MANVFDQFDSKNPFDQFDENQFDGIDPDVPVEGRISPQQPQPQPSVGDKILGAAETALTAVTGATGGALGYGIGAVEGLVGEATGELETGEGREVAEEYASSLTYQPRSEVGQEYTQELGEAFGVLPPILGSTPVSTLKSAIPARSIPDNILANRRAKSQLLKEQIQSGNPNIETVTKIINESGDVVTSKASKKALSTLGGGKREKETVSILERLDPASKKQVSKMLDIVERGEKEPLFREQNRPSDILGESVAERARAIVKKNEQAGKRIGATANKLKNKPVNIQQPINNFFNSLSEMGVTFTRGDDGWITPDFSRSKFEGGSKQGLTVLINELASGDIKFKQAHDLKRAIRDNVDFDKLGAGKLKADSEKLLKDLSRGIDDVLDSESTEYRKANEVFAKTVDLKDQFQKMAGKNIDLFEDASEISLSNKARRLSSQAASRANIMQTLNQADKTLSELGISFKDNIPALNSIANRFDDMFRITPDTSMQGVVERGVTNIAEASLSPLAVGRRALEKGAELLEPTNEAKIKAIREVIKQKPKNKTK